MFFRVFLKSKRMSAGEFGITLLLGRDVMIHVVFPFTYNINKVLHITASVSTFPFRAVGNSLL